MQPMNTNLTDDLLNQAIQGNDFKDLLNRVKRAETFVSSWHTNIKRWRRLYNMNHYNRPGTTNEILYSDPTYTNTVDLSVGIMLGNDLRWHAFGFSPSAAEQKATGQMEKLIAGIMEVNNEREEALLIYELFLNFNRDGGGAIYSVYDGALANELRETVDVPDGTQGTKQVFKFMEVPIRTKIIDPLNIVCLPGGPKKWLLIGREEERSMLDIETTYGVKIDRFQHLSQEEKASYMAVFKDIWDFVWVVQGQATDAPDAAETLPEVPQRKLVVRNTRLYMNLPIFGPQIMEGYDDLPYSIQFFKPVGKESTEWHSILTPLESSVVMLERSFNRRAKQIDVYTAMPLIVKSQPGRPVVIDPGLYNSVSITPDESIEFPQWPGNAPDVQEHMDMLRSRIQQSGFSDVMFGSGNNAVAGYALSQLGDQNRIRLEQPINHLELLLTTWAKKTMKLLHKFAPGTIMCVYGHQKGADYMDYVEMDKLIGYSIRAEIRPNFPNEEMRRVAMSTQVKGTISDYTRMERYLGIEQPEDEQERKLIEAAENHPITMQYALMAQLDKMAKDGDQIAAMALQSLQQNGLPGQPGRPDQGNKPEQLQGVASPTGQEPVPGQTPPGTTPAEQQASLATATPNTVGGINGLQ